MYWKLDGHDVVPATFNEWIAMYKKPDARIVRQTRIEKVLISTVFLGTDHSFGMGTPLFFETMIFDWHENEYQERYPTWDAAVEGHARALSMVLSEGWPEGSP